MSDLIHIDSKQASTPRSQETAMDPALKAKWVEALRSGEFLQGQGKLHNPQNDSYCCLGVLCKIRGAQWASFEGGHEDEDEGHWVPETYKYVPVLDGECLAVGEDEELREDFCKKLGIKDQGHLIGLNDGIGSPSDPYHQPSKPFPEIADYIETNL